MTKPLKKSIRLFQSTQSLELSLSDAERDMKQAKAAETDRRVYAIYNVRECQERIERTSRELAFVRWVEEYVAAHDVNPVIERQSVDAWGSKAGTVRVEDRRYKVCVSRGKSVRIAFKRRGENRGFKWNCDIHTVEPWKQIDRYECGKSESLGGAAVRAHLRETFQERQKTQASPNHERH